MKNKNILWDKTMLTNEQKNKISEEFKLYAITDDDTGAFLQYAERSNGITIADFFFSQFDSLQSEAKEELRKEIENFAIMKGSIIDKLEETSEERRITNLLNENLEIGYRQAIDEVLKILNK